MNRWRGSTGAKVAAWVGITVSVLLFLTSAVGAAVLWESGVYEAASEESYREALYRNAAEQYALRALDNWNVGGADSFPDAPNFHYGIIKADNIDDLDLKKEDIYTESNFENTAKLDTERLYTLKYEIGADSTFYYEGSLLGGSTIEEHTYTSEETIYEVVYNQDDGIFYYETSTAYYPVRQVSMADPTADGTKIWLFVYDAEKGAYQNTYVLETENAELATAAESTAEGTAAEAAKTVQSLVQAREAYGLDGSEQTEWIVNLEAVQEVLSLEYMTFDLLADAGWPEEAWGVVLLDGEAYLCDGNSVWLVDDDFFVQAKEILQTEYALTGNGTLRVTHEPDEQKRETCWVVAENPGEVGTGISSDLFVQANTLATVGYGLRYGIYGVMLAAFALGLSLFVFLMNAAGHRKDTDAIVTTWVDRMPFDIYLAFAVLGMGICYAFMLESSYYADQFPWGIVFVTLLFMAGWILLLSFLTFAVRVKCGKWWQNTLCWWVIHGIYGILQVICRNLRQLWKVLLIIGVLSLAEFWVVSWDGIGRITMFWFIEKLVLVPLILLAVVQMERLKSGAERMAEGDLEHRIDTERMFWDFKEHGENLNNISHGMSRAVDERMKSERFKTELITNVSHDIKTPLTSIINYVDLLEKEDLQNEKAAEYLEVLERQSARLKKLIEDLMEASKASTGNLAVHLERLEAGVSLVQIVGEFEEKLEAKELQLLIEKPSAPVYIQADSRHFWRVVDNLMNNICKYAQPGTRVYVNLETENTLALLTFRNTSKYPLNISSEELMERFVRGDSSRNTEGSGLGLSIAKSLMELMGGTFALYVDGDLFKVVLQFPVSEAEKEDTAEAEK